MKWYEKYSCLYCGADTWEKGKEIPGGTICLDCNLLCPKCGEDMPESTHCNECDHDIRDKNPE